GETIDNDFRALHLGAGARGLSVFRPGATCLAHAHDGCAAIARCLGYKNEKMGEPKCRPDHDRCDGNVLRNDYSSVDGTCLGLTCSAAARTCLGAGEGAACDVHTFASSCRDGRPVVCYDDVVRIGPRCDDFGLTCDDFEASGFVRSKMCRGSGAPC